MENIYNLIELEEGMENNEISAIEEAFMKGYLSL